MRVDLTILIALLVFFLPRKKLPLWARIALAVGVLFMSLLIQVFK